MGAARPAGASQPFLPACFLIDTAAYISRARCCSSEAWRLAKPSQTDSCAASSVSGPFGCLGRSMSSSAAAARFWAVAEDPGSSLRAVLEVAYPYTHT